MNSTIELLLNRKSVRAFSDRPVGEAEKDIILTAAMRAPTAGNMMLYSIMEIDDQTIKDRLAILCDHQPFIAKTPFLVLFLVDYQRWFDYYLQAGVEELCRERGLQMRRPQEGDLLLAWTDTVIAAHTAVVAAESLGIGSCYIGDTIENYEILREMFELPQYVLPATLVCFGYPTPAQAARKLTTRFAKETIVHKNRYHHLNREELEQMMQPRNAQFKASADKPEGLKNIGQANFLNKFIADFSIEMTRSSRVMLKDWTRENEG